MAIPPAAEHASVRELARFYRGFIIDIFGVLHDGVVLNPAVLTTLTALRAQGARVCLLSNSPRRAASITLRLSDMGLYQNLYDGLVSSGELVYAAMSGAVHLDGMPAGGRYLHAGPPELCGLLEGLPHQPASSPAEADFILATGDVAHDAAWISIALARNLPMICANPDLDVIIAGRRVACAGSLARRYEGQGGHVHRVGKPGVEAFVAALQVLDLPRAQVIMIGDSLATDIAGANSAGLASALVLSGVHRDQIDLHRSAARNELHDLFEAHAAAPDYLLEQFSWDQGFQPIA
ncbi:TIGR01459 family HAD-type hydrolase [Rhizobium sp. BG4]|uniref:TIGR01459 family HAD-type hydrolase n=1 Tax=Rhizobium sp. BG4 TaxID=2613770 RepID=UPI00193D5EDD|nr:TIGR01459 family HAD-type hydrolase [Rhizobium sp. BG4]